ncbi:MAG: GNAT family N-acetyltransferase [Nitrososphaerales archaeon]
MPSDLIEAYRRGLIEAVKEGYKWDIEKLPFEGKDLKLWNSVEALNFSLFSLKHLLKKAGSKKRKEYYDILQRLISLLDEALKLLDPDNYAKGRGFQNVTFNEESLREALTKLEEVFQLYRQHYYLLSINVEVERVAGRSHVMETPIIYGQLRNAIYGIRRYLNLPYSESPLPEPKGVEEPKIISKRKKKVELPLEDRLTLDKLVTFTALKHSTDDSSKWLFSCDVCGSCCMSWKVKEHKYSHISLLKAPPYWSKIVFENGEVKIAQIQQPNEWLIAHDLNRRAKKEEPSFRSLNPKHHIVFVLVNGSKIIGYTSWGYFKEGKPLSSYLKSVPPEQRKPFASQIYIVPDERRKGYGSKLLQETFKIMCEGYPKKLIVESPNEASIMMLRKLGYVKLEGGKIIGVNAEFFQSW